MRETHRLGLLEWPTEPVPIIEIPSKPFERARPGFEAPPRNFHHRAGRVRSRGCHPHLFYADAQIVPESSSSPSIALADGRFEPPRLCPTPGHREMDNHISL